MTLTVYNWLTRRKEAFQPIHEGWVGMYVCGPTVYGHSHIGHAKVYIAFDIVFRYLRYRGYKVRYVRNITDVGHLTDDADEGEDKILRRARQEQVEPMEVVQTYMDSFFEDMDALNVLRPNISPRASCHIPEQVELVKGLLQRGHAYEAGGSIYFDVSSWPEYGKLSGRKVEEQEEGARVTVNPEKDDPADFAVWKKAEPGHILRWPSPWGQGYPGWHLECSVMATKYLGQPFDIHGGGLENIFPHNESEVAQCEAAYDEPFARYWVLNNMVTVNGTKMGKSLGNFITIKDALARHDPMTIRFFVLSSHYRSNTDFSEEALEAAGRGYERLIGTVSVVRQRLAEADRDEQPDETFAEVLRTYETRFLRAMDDDLNTPQALAALFDLNKEVNTLLNSGGYVSGGTLAAIDETYRRLGGTILGLIPDEIIEQESAGLEEALIGLLIELRAQAREQRNWATADTIRDRLTAAGVALEDRPDGTTWHLIPS